MDEPMMPRTMLESIERGMRLVNDSDISVDDALDIATYIVSTICETSAKVSNQRTLLAAATVVGELIRVRNA